MKLNEIVIGAIYETKSGPSWLKVKVVGTRIQGFSKRTKFAVQTLDTGKILPKARTAAALRPPQELHGTLPSIRCGQDLPNVQP